MRKLKYYFLFVDIAFILYWFITLLKWIPGEYLFKDYTNPILSAWNWSFLPLDLFISATGLTSVYLWNKNNVAWQPIALISLVLTFCSGLQAIAFWVIRVDYDITWWVPNLFLMLYPLFFIKPIIKEMLVNQTQNPSTAS